MKGKFFGFQPADPCPVCGTPRVGEDWDDGYCIVPGVLHPAVGPTCSFGGWDKKGSEWFATIRGPEGIRYLSSREEPTLCPICSGRVTKKEVEVPFTDRYQRKGTFSRTLWVCENSEKREAYIERLGGCPQCTEQFFY